MEKTYITYDHFHQLSTQLSAQIDQSGLSFMQIIAPSRGGLLPGTILSHMLNISLFPIILSTRDYKDFEYFNSQIENIKHSIFVDDINDTGKTIAMFREITGYDIPTATVFERHTTINKSTFTSQVINDDSWIVFPWEQ